MPISDQTLHVKSFFAASTPEAIEMARVELGPNALLIRTREAPPEARHLGEFEVVFGSYPQPDSAASAAPGPPAGAPSGLDDLRQRMEEIQDLLSRITPASGAVRFHGGAAERALLAAGLDPDLAQEIDEAVRQRAAKRTVHEIGKLRATAGFDASTLAADLVSEIESRFEVQPELHRITALVGPPGSGKTTTLVKLAVTRGLAQGRRPRLISVDTQRVGGAEQLRTFAAILGVPFQAVESVAALAQTVDTAPADDLVLIDTPGYGAAILRELGAELAAFLAGRQDIDTHLVLTASTSPACIGTLAATHAIFQPSKLLFTRLDETNSYASAFCEAVRQSLPLSFFGLGQDIPDDIAAAVKQTVSESLVRELPQFVQAVA